MAGLLTGILNPMAWFTSDEDLYGKKPVIPEYPSAKDILSTTISENQRALPAAEELTKRINASNQKAYQDLFRAGIPNYDQILKKVSENALSSAKGELPQDVADLVKRQAAEGAVRGGYQGSQVADFAKAQQLGLTSLEVQSSFDRWIKNAQQLTTPGFVDVTRSFLGPEAILGLAQGKFQRDMLVAGVAAAPDPAIRGSFDTEMQAIGQILSIYSGGAGYTGTYAPDYGNTLGGGGGQNREWLGSGKSYRSGGGGIGAGEAAGVASMAGFI